VCRIVFVPPSSAPARAPSLAPTPTSSLVAWVALVAWVVWVVVSVVAAATEEGGEEEDWED
jgi:hypothetical protein